MNWYCRLGLLNTPTASLQKGKTPSHDECPVYDTKQSDSEATVMLLLCGMQSTPNTAIVPRSTLAQSDSTW